MRRILFLATLILLIAIPSFAAPVPWIKSLATAQRVAKEKKQMIFVDLFAQWCGWCHRWEADVYPTDVFQKATSNMVLLRLDTEDGSDGTKFAQRYEVTSLPTFLILNFDMTVVGAILVDHAIAIKEDGRLHRLATLHTTACDCGRMANHGDCGRPATARGPRLRGGQTTATAVG